MEQLKNFFKTQSLLHKSKDGKIKGAMSPVLAADEAAKALGFNVHGLARLWFTDENINQVYEKGEGLTGHDTLLVLENFSNTACIYMLVDKGSNGCPAAMRLREDKEATVTPIYRKHKFERNLTDLEINEIMEYCHENAAEVFKIAEYNPQLKTISA